MRLLHALSRGLRAIIDPKSADRDVDDELRHYMDEAAAAHIARGLAPDAARRAVRLEAGTALGAREQIRESGWEHALLTFAADVRYAARRLRAEPTVTLVIVLTLAIGIGASTAIFSAVRPILLEPLPYPQPRRLVSIWDRTPDGVQLDATYGTFAEVAARSRSFQSLAAADNWQPALLGIAEPERLDGQRVTPGFFRVFGIAPARGRDFEAADAVAGAPRVVIVSAKFARRRYGASNDVIGRSLDLDGDMYTVVGVMPAGFENVLTPLAQIWTPLRYRVPASFQSAEWGHHLTLVGRLAADVSREQTIRELDAIARTPAPEFARPPWASLKQGLIVNAMRDDVARGARPALVAVAGAVLLVLTIAAANVANLLLASAARRGGEFAMRAALGASRARVVGQLLAESALVAAIGGAAGVAIAAASVDAIVALTPTGLPRTGAIAIDGMALAFALATTTVVAFAVGLAPALHYDAAELHGDLQRGARAVIGGRALRRALVVGEVALAIVLLVGAGLLFRSVSRLMAIPPGFAASHLLTVQIEDAHVRADRGDARRRFFEAAAEQVRRVPGVAAAGLTSQLPLGGDLDGYGVRFEGLTANDDGDVGSALRYAVTSDYLEAMRIPLRRGRTIDAHDTAATERVALINESFAARLFKDRDPIGQRLKLGPEIERADAPWRVVVGVVGDVKQSSLALATPDAVYVPAAQWLWSDNPQTMVVRTRVDPASLVPAIRAAIWSVDKDQPILHVAAMDAVVADSEATRRFALVVFEAFGLVALALAAIGIYGVLSGSVTERTREIGVRSALGASRRDIVSLIVGQGLALTAIGSGIGIAGAILASRAIAALLYGVSRLDTATYAGVVSAIACVALFACALPAMRAARIDPAITLRAD